MIRVSIFLITAALIAGMVGCDGNGSDPYADFIKIYNWTNLDDIRNNLVVKYVLMNDLDSTTAGYEELASPTANGGEGWQPIGTEDDLFTGTFDGQGYEIRDLFINRPGEDLVGLFGTIDEEGVIANIGVVNAAVTGNLGVGGLVGASVGTVSNSYSSGSVAGEEFVGGLVGFNGEAGTVNNSYATGDVAGASYVGGLVGVNTHSSIVSTSFSTCSVTGNSSTGGLVGANNGVATNCFWNTETSGQSSSDGGTGKNTTEMQDIATFSGAGWDIIAVANPATRNLAYIWNIVDGETYPFLSWQS